MIEIAPWGCTCLAERPLLGLALLCIVVGLLVGVIAGRAWP